MQENNHKPDHEPDSEQPHGRGRHPRAEGEGRGGYARRQRHAAHDVHMGHGGHEGHEGQAEHGAYEGHGGHDVHAGHEDNPGRRGRNFWHEWRDERHHHGHEDEFMAGQALSPKEMEAWREFFHQSFGTWPEDHWIFGGRRFSPWHQGMDSFNPFVATLLSKGGGLLPLYVLHLVAQQPRYGSEIMDILAERTNGQWVSNPGAIYPLLTLLESQGLITGEWVDPTKRSVRIYTITPSGQAELTRIKTIVTPKVEETLSVLEAFLQDLQGQPQPPAADGSDAQGAA